MKTVLILAFLIAACEACAFDVEPLPGKSLPVPLPAPLPVLPPILVPGRIAPPVVVPTSIAQPVAAPVAIVPSVSPQVPTIPSQPVGAVPVLVEDASKPLEKVAASVDPVVNESVPVIQTSSNSSSSGYSSSFSSSASSSEVVSSENVSPNNTQPATEALNSRVRRAPRIKPRPSPPRPHRPSGSGSHLAGQIGAGAASGVGSTLADRAVTKAKSKFDQLRDKLRGHRARRSPLALIGVAARGIGQAVRGGAKLGARQAGKHAAKEAGQCEFHKREHRRLNGIRNRNGKQNDDLRRHRDFIQQHCGGRFKRNAIGFGIGGYGGYYGRPYGPYGYGSYGYGPYGYGMNGYGGYYGRPYGYGYGYGMRPWF